MVTHIRNPNAQGAEAEGSRAGDQPETFEEAIIASERVSRKGTFLRGHRGVTMAQNSGRTGPC